MLTQLSALGGSLGLSLGLQLCCQFAATVDVLSYYFMVGDITAEQNIVNVVLILVVVVIVVSFLFLASLIVFQVHNVP